MGANESSSKITIYDAIYAEHCREASEEESEADKLKMIASRDYCREMAKKRPHRGWDIPLQETDAPW